VQICFPQLSVWVHAAETLTLKQLIPVYVLQMSGELTSRERERIQFTAIAFAKGRFAHDRKPKASIVYGFPRKARPFWALLICLDRN